MLINKKIDKACEFIYLIKVIKIENNKNSNIEINNYINLY